MKIDQHINFQLIIVYNSSINSSLCISSETIQEFFTYKTTYCNPDLNIISINSFYVWSKNFCIYVFDLFKLFIFY